MPTISICKGKGSLRHNERSIKNKSEESRSWNPLLGDRNIIYVNDPINKIYDDLFGKSLEKYNAKQKRDDRKITDYLDKISRSKQEKPFYELIVQIGNMDEVSKGSKEYSRICEALDEYNQGFQDRNPNFKVIQQITHNDEKGLAHTHIDFVPFSSGNKRGLEVKNSFSGALKEMGFVGQNAFEQWRAREQEAIEKLMKEHDLTPEKGSGRTEHLNVKAYKEYKYFKSKAEEEYKSLSDAQKAVKFEKKALDDIKVQSDKIIAEFDVLTGHKEEYEKSVAIITDLENQEKELEDVKPVLFNKQKMLVSKELFERMKELIKSLRKAIKRIVAFNIELMKENDDLIDELKGFKSKEKYGKYLTNDEIDLNRYEKYQMQNQIEELEEENKNFSKYLELNGLDSDEIEWIKNPKMAKMALLEEEEEEEFF